MKLAKRAPADARSVYVDETLAAKLRQREQQLIRACQIANRSLAVRAVERDWDAMPDEIREPWDDITAR